MKRSSKIVALNTEYAKKKYVEFQQQQCQLIFRGRRLATIFAGALIIFVIVGVRISHDMQRIHQLNGLRVGANTEMRGANADVNQLRQDVSLLKDDEYITKLARGKFFYLKGGEKVYPILESNTDSSTNETDQSTGSTTTK